MIPHRGSVNPPKATRGISPHGSDYRVQRNKRWLRARLILQASTRASCRWCNWLLVDYTKSFFYQSPLDLDLDKNEMKWDRFEIEISFQTVILGLSLLESAWGLWCCDVNNTKWVSRVVDMQSYTLYWSCIYIYPVLKYCITGWAQQQTTIGKST